MRIIIAIVLVLFAATAEAQDTVRITHKNYTTAFSKSRKYPVLVEWWITKKKLICKTPVKRSDKFEPDPELYSESNVAPSYFSSGFDRGHLSPAADARCDAVSMQESFYFTNMAPQYPGLNRGQWKVLEEWTREQALLHDSIKVSAGCIGNKQKVKTLTVPTHCWKVIQITKQKTTLGFVFPNQPEKTVSFEQHKVSLDSIKKLTKFTFR